MQIDPERLMHLRRRQGLSRAKLAERSKVSKRTIQRLELESDRSQTTREHTLDRLAKALGVQSGVLTGELPLSGPVKAPDAERVQIGALIAPKARLAYDLVKRRYGVSVTDVVNMAPLFFVLLAEGSLTRRREKLEEAGEAIHRLDEMRDEVGHWIFLTATTVALDADTLEEESIAKADIFGEYLLSGASGASPNEPFDPSASNPFASYLGKLTDDLANSGIVDVERGDLSYGSPIRFPNYDICAEELDGITNRCPDARRALELGEVRISEIPEELMTEDNAEKRAAWLRDRLPEIYRDLEEGEPRAHLAELQATMTPPDLKDLLISEFGLRREQGDHA